MKRQPSRRTVAIATWSAIPAALVVSGLLVAQSSYAAFSATTDNTVNNWATGTVLLRDDDNGAALFTVENLRPGLSGSKCITVTSEGAVPAAVKVYAANTASTKQLGDHLNLTIAEGARCEAAGTSIFSGSLTELAATAKNFGTGLGSWQPAGNPGESRAYTIGYTFSADAPNSTQAATAKTDFVWEAQSR
ncbi:hypothetical protein [Nakamurella aerolata]|uniref:Camelysin metallo-endopeptidase n=1 Tax=Nakamurella aerolata TaxID=1656892 RepID=A0A849AB49_9ACTN|nr:hypothetical protein [Nakamurella aerolata]NNG36368.1 hypothetical protein [Nakamurella aerolata]